MAMAIKLNKREKYYVSAAIGFIVLFVIIQFIVFPVLDKRNTLQRRVSANAERLEKMRALEKEYQTLHARSDQAKTQLTGREAGFTLFSFLDGLVGKIGLKDQISYMKPSSSATQDPRFKLSSVEMKFQAITLEQLTQYLFQVETTGKSAQVKRISITQTSKQEGFLDVVLQVETLEAA